MPTDDLHLLDDAIRRKGALLRALERGPDREMAPRLRPELERLELRASVLRGPPEERLRALLVRLFEAGELRWFLRQAFGAELVASLPTEPLSQVVIEAISALDRRGWLDDELREQLSRERPTFADEIHEIFTALKRR